MPTKTSFVLTPPTGRTVTIAGYEAPVDELEEATEYREPGTLTAGNLLLSGDNPHREGARARFTIDPATGLLAPMNPPERTHIMTMTRRLTRTVTADTEESITAPELPADDRTGDGYDWMDAIPGSGWVALPSWGSEGWDAGSWPYIIFAVARHRDEEGELYGYGTYVEGDTSSRWFRSQDQCFEAITEDVFFHWKAGQSHGPENLPETAAELPSRDRLPYDWAS